MSRAPRILLVTIAAAVSVAGVAATAPAQTTEAVERPFRGLFRGGETPAGEALILDVSAFTVYDARAGEEALIGLGRELRGTSSEMAASLAYRKPARRATYAVSGAASFRHHRDLSSFFVATYSARGNVSVPVGRRTSLVTYADAISAPYFAFSPFLDEDDFAAGAPRYESDNAVSTDQLRSVATRFAVQSRVSQHGSFVIQTDLRHSTLQEREVTMQGFVGTTEYEHRMSRSAAFRLGYEFHYAEQQPSLYEHYSRIHDVNVGIHADWARTPTRRTQLTLEGGPWFVVQRNRSRSGIQVHAGVNHMIGRTWTLAARYRREVRFLEGFDQPFASNSASGSLSGYAGRRWMLIFSGGISRGEAGQGGADGRGFDGDSATAEVQYALTSRLALFGHYAFYRYRFGPDVVVPELALSALSRSGVRAGVTLWLPLVSKEAHGTR